MMSQKSIYEGHLLGVGIDVILEIRLQAVPFWIVERSREIAKRKKKKKKLERTSGGGLGERLFSFVSPRSSLAHPLDYPERDCLQSTLKS